MTAQKKATTRRTTRKSKIETPNKLELLLQSIVELFPNDPTTPGVSLAWLPRESCFYISITRFHKSYAENRYTIFKWKGDRLATGFTELAKFWKRQINSTNATEQLKKVL